MAKVVLPGSLARLFPGCPVKCELAAESVAEVIELLNRDWPGMRDRVCDSSGAIRHHLHVFVDGERAGLDTGVGARSEVIVIAAVSGG